MGNKSSTIKDQNIGISLGIVRSISKLREDNELNDFEVIVDGETFSCHSVILASCSDFFRGLLRSNMKEKLEMKVQLSNISSPIFQLILKTLYTGCDFLTKENVLEVWSAVHQLQIPFLIKHCEDFIESNISPDNVGVCKQRAELLQSDRICTFIFKFMCENFEVFRKTEAMLHLKFQDLMKIITNDQLKVSCEDEVLFSIFDWVGYGNVLSTQKVNFDSIKEEEQIDTSIIQEELNDRKKLLMPLLNSTRYSLASEACIVSLYKNKLIQSDTLLKDSLFEAFTFKFYQHGHYPTTAIHRDCSNLEHVGVYLDISKRILAFSFKQNKSFSFERLPKASASKLTVYNGKLYTCSIDSNPNEIYALQTNHWKLVTEIAHAVKLFLAHQKYIYVFASNEKQITRFNPDTSTLKLETFKHEIENLSYGVSLSNTIVVFSSVDNSGEEKTAVHSWNTETNVWTKLDNLNFSSQNMTSFRGDRDTYILDSNGNLWKLTNSDIIGFTFVDKIWKGEHNIMAAELFRESLYVFFYNPEPVDDMIEKVVGVFSTLKIWQVVDRTSPFVQYVVAKHELKPL